jgi:hypothetical protein
MKHRLAIYQRIGIPEWQFAREADYGDRDALMRRISEYVEVDFPPLAVAEGEPDADPSEGAGWEMEGYDSQRQRETDDVR